MHVFTRLVWTYSITSLLYTGYGIWICVKMQMKVTLDMTAGNLKSSSAICLFFSLCQQPANAALDSGSLAKALDVLFDTIPMHISDHFFMAETMLQCQTKLRNPASKSISEWQRECSPSSAPWASVVWNDRYIRLKKEPEHPTWDASWDPKLRTPFKHVLPTSVCSLLLVKVMLVVMHLEVKLVHCLWFVHLFSRSPGCWSLSQQMWGNWIAIDLSPNGVMSSSFS